MFPSSCCFSLPIISTVLPSIFSTISFPFLTQVVIVVIIQFSIYGILSVNVFITLYFTKFRSFLMLAISYLFVYPDASAINI